MKRTAQIVKELGKVPKGHAYLTKLCKSEGRWKTSVWETKDCNSGRKAKEKTREDPNCGERPSPIYRVQAETLIKNKTWINAEVVNYSPASTFVSFLIFARWAFCFIFSCLILWCSGMPRQHSATELPPQPICLSFENCSIYLSFENEYIIYKT